MVVTSSPHPHLVSDVAPDTVAPEDQDQRGQRRVEEEQVVTGDEQEEEVLVVAAVVQLDRSIQEDGDEVGGVADEEGGGQHDDCYCHLPVAFLTLFLEHVSPHVVDDLSDLQYCTDQADD